MGIEDRPEVQDFQEFFLEGILVRVEFEKEGQKLSSLLEQYFLEMQKK